MKILISCDMEGVSGVLTWEHVTPGKPEYERFRRLMTAEANAAVRGVLEGGADEVVVADGHWNCSNILIEELDPRARLNAGSPSPFSMAQGVDSGVDGAVFLGYHARVGARNAILDHTWSDNRVAGLWLNGQLVGESGLNGALCGHFGVPVIMITGDQTLCGEATALLGPIETVVTKRATGRQAAECLPPAVVQGRIQETAARAMGRLRTGQTPKPFRLSTPITVAIEFVHSEMADRAAFLPGACRPEGKRIEFTASDMPAAYNGLRAAVMLAGT